MSAPSLIWVIDIPIVTPAEAQILEPVLEELGGAVSQRTDEDERPVAMTCFLDHEPDRPSLETALRIAASAGGFDLPDFTIVAEEQKDWLAEYVSSHPPLVAGRYFVYASHYDGAVPPGKVGLKIEAATAFGTGEHASTYGCLLATDLLAKKYQVENVLDMGCGSVILGIAAAKTWGARVTGVDIDAESVRVANLNADINRVAPLVNCYCGDGYRTIGLSQAAPFDLIYANILARPLRSMAAQLSQHLAPGGFAVLAGFLDRDAPWVFAAHRAHGLKLWKRIHIRGWQTLILRKK